MIRKHQKKDLEALMDIWYKSSSIAHPFLDSKFVEKVKKDMKNLYIPNSETWVYEEDNIIKGFISMIGNEIGGLFIMPNQQSKGIGTKLVNFISQFHEELEVEVFKNNRIGRGFYDKYGFSVINEYMHEESNQFVLRMKFKK